MTAKQTNTKTNRFRLILGLNGLTSKLF